MYNDNDKKPHDKRVQALLERPGRRETRTAIQKQKRSAKRYSVIKKIATWSFHLTTAYKVTLVIAEVASQINVF